MGCTSSKPIENDINDDGLLNSRPYNPGDSNEVRRLEEEKRRREGEIRYLDEDTTLPNRPKSHTDFGLVPNIHVSAPVPTVACQTEPAPPEISDPSLARNNSKLGKHTQTLRTVSGSSSGTVHRHERLHELPDSSPGRTSSWPLRSSNPVGFGAHRWPADEGAGSGEPIKSTLGGRDESAINDEVKKLN